MRLSGAVLVFALAGLSPARADDLEQIGTARRGKLGFVFVGASMTDARGLDQGVHCLKPEAEVDVTLPPEVTRPRLVQAILYVSGTLIGGDVDFQNPNRRIFDDGLLIFDNPADRDQLLALARTEADRAVRLLLPGAADFIEVSAPPDRPYVAVGYTPAGAEIGNFATFVTPIDVTDLVRALPSSEGRYAVRELQADVCRGLEAICDDTPNSPSCTTTSAIHTKAAASFALLLVFEDPALPLSSIAVFEGLQQLNGNSVLLSLSGGIVISDPPAGDLALYAIEGDLAIGGPLAAGTAPPCDAEEYLYVQGRLDPLAPGTCVTDPDNPLGNLFNSTINTTPRRLGSAPICNRPAYQCCPAAGVGLCGETGVDIDTFNISSALEAGATDVNVQLGTDSDQVNIAVAVLDVDVFEPVLVVDSQIRILSEKLDGFVRLGVPLELSVVVSNTGNVEATDAFVALDAPPFTSGLRILSVPPGAVDESTSTGGVNNTGHVQVRGFVVPRGEAREIRLQVDTLCPAALERDLRVTATVSSAELATFSIDGPEAVGRGPGVGACLGIDPGGPFASALAFVVRDLAGGGGCAAAGASWLLALAALGLWKRRR